MLPRLLQVDFNLEAGVHWVLFWFGLTVGSRCDPTCARSPNREIRRLNSLPLLWRGGGGPSGGVLT